MKKTIRQIDDERRAQIADENQAQQRRHGSADQPVFDLGLHEYVEYPVNSYAQ
ncbi:hypothetical protein ACFS07_01790 [Undibacterium arcticum]